MQEYSFVIFSKVTLTWMICLLVDLTLVKVKIMDEPNWGTLYTSMVMPQRNAVYNYDILIKNALKIA
jgi:hypothetical protein